MIGWSGWRSAASSAAQIISNLVGQDIVARSIQLTSTGLTAIQSAGTLAIGNVTTAISMANDANRISWTGGLNLDNVSGLRSNNGFNASAGNWSNNARVWGSNTAPTISSGFGTSPSIVAANGTFAFTLDVGTGGVATSGVIGLPAATTGWALTIQNLSTNTATVFITKQTATTTTTATIGNYDAAGAAAAWVASNVLLITATAY